MREIFLPQIIINNGKEAITNAIQASLLMILLSIFIPPINMTTNPKTKVKFTKFEPKTLPKETIGILSKLAAKAITNSGKATAKRIKKDAIIYSVNLK